MPTFMLLVSAAESNLGQACSINSKFSKKKGCVHRVRNAPPTPTYLPIQIFHFIYCALTLETGTNRQSRSFFHKQQFQD